MKQELYRACVMLAKDSPDGETAWFYVVTKEVNGYAVFFSNHEETVLEKWHTDRNAAIEDAVDQARKSRAELQPYYEIEEGENQ